MTRALAIAKALGTVIAIELCVPGGTLIILTLLFTGRSASPLVQKISKRFPSLFHLMTGAMARLPRAPGVAANR